MHVAAKFMRAVNFAILPKNLFCRFNFCEITLSANFSHNKLSFTESVFAYLQRIVKSAKFTALKNFVLLGKKNEGVLEPFFEK